MEKFNLFQFDGKFLIFRFDGKSNVFQFDIFSHGLCKIKTNFAIKRKKSYLHCQFDGIHTLDRIPQMRQHIARRNNSSPRRQFSQLGHLHFPSPRI